MKKRISRKAEVGKPERPLQAGREPWQLEWMIDSERGEEPEAQEGLRLQTSELRVVEFEP